jgi:D-alanine-D-alanine ligase
MLKRSIIKRIKKPKAEFTLRHNPEKEDRSKVRKLLNKTGFFSAEEVKVALELIEEKLSLGSKSTYQFIFAERDNALFGYSCYGRIPLTKESFDLYWIAVEPDCQGGGIGKMLLLKTEESIKKMEGVHLYIETASRKQYDPTRQFYLSCGYKKAAFFKDFYSPGDGKTVFYKKLK